MLFKLIPLADSVVAAHRSLTNPRHTKGMKVQWHLLLRRGFSNNIFPQLSKAVNNMNQKGIIAVCQMRATDNKAENLETCKNLILSAKRMNAQVIFFPEACDYVAGSKAQTIQMAESINGPLLEAFKNLAKLHDVWLSLGGIHIKVDDKTVSNIHVLISSDGKIKSTYSKLHLFDVDYKEGNVFLQESSYCKPGSKIELPVETPAGKIALSICYDLRFPELSTSLALQKADILTYPSAFTFATGACHWEPLLRARAIENQCYVVAAAQSGKHNDKRTSWGHAMVVDPWGTIVAQCSEGNNIAIAEVDHELLRSTRLAMPVFEHRRNDVYPAMQLQGCQPLPALGDQDTVTYQFGQISVKGSFVFARSCQSIAFTNRKCVVPGHVLVASIRCVQRMSELSAGEISDLFTLVNKVVSGVEKAYKGTSATVAVQDGKDAGQTIQHVHVHILPRRPGDYINNDDIYRDLAEHDKEDSSIGKWRTDEEMAQEAQFLRPFFD